MSFGRSETSNDFVYCHLPFKSLYERLKLVEKNVVGLPCTMRSRPKMLTETSSCRNTFTGICAASVAAESSIVEEASFFFFASMLIGGKMHGNTVREIHTGTPLSARRPDRSEEHTSEL